MRARQSSVGACSPLVVFAILMVTLDVTIKIRSTKTQTMRPMVENVRDHCKNWAGSGWMSGLAVLIFV